VICGAFVATLFMLGGAGVIASGERSQIHLDQRHPTYASLDAPAVGVAKATYVIVPGGFSQVPILWISPLPGHDSDPVLTPPGLSALPGPGEAVLSPGLADAGYTAEDFGFTTSTVGQGADGAIGDAGLVSLSEGFIIVRPLRDVPGPGDATINASQIAGYGLPGVTYGSMESALDVPTRQTAWLGATWLVFLPALFLLVGSARATSPLRSARAQALYRLGVSRAKIRLVAALETSFLVAAGGIPAVGLWLSWAQHTTTLPFADAILLPDALTLPLSVVLGLVVIAVALAAVAGMLVGVRPRGRSQGARRVRVLYLVPLAASLLAMAVVPGSFGWLGGRLPQESSLALLFGGAIGTFASLPLALPVLTGWTARVLGFATHSETWFAGRVLTLRRHNLARPGVMVGALVFIAGSAFAILSGAMSTTNSWWPDAGERAVFSTRWDVSAQRYAPDLGARGHDVMLAPVFDVTQSAADSTYPPEFTSEVYFDSCERARAFFGVDGSQLACDEGSPDAAGIYLDRLIRLGTAPTVDASEVWVSAPHDWTQVDVVRALSGRDFLAVSTVSGASNGFGHPGIDWFATGWATASLLLLCALLRELGDRVVLSAGETRRLERAGATPTEANDILTIAAMTPALVAVPIGFLASVLFALRGYGEGLTVLNLGEIALVSVVVTGLALAVLIGALRLQRASR